MADPVLTSFDWALAAPQGLVRHLRVRWRLEEAEQPYHVESVPFSTRSAVDSSHTKLSEWCRA